MSPVLPLSLSPPCSKGTLRPSWTPSPDLMREKGAGKIIVAGIVGIGSCGEGWEGTDPGKSQLGCVTPRGDSSDSTARPPRWVQLLLQPCQSRDLRAEIPNFVLGLSLCSPWHHLGLAPAGGGSARGCPCPCPQQCPGLAEPGGAQEEQEQLQLELRGLPAFHHLLPAWLAPGDPKIPAWMLGGVGRSPRGCWGGCAGMGAFLVEKRDFFFCQKAAFPAWEFPPALGFAGQSQPHGQLCPLWCHPELDSGSLDIGLCSWERGGIGNGVPAASSGDFPSIPAASS